ncbi:hypothetical protein F5Y11DRAFT_364472 [Daldinia sp. FL1419]|nr:hypothetical protein F5Y11DRAFT_364472 [Daldinia sp. FL1419]
MSTINIVKYFFHRNNVPSDAKTIQQLINLSYWTARDQHLYPKAVFIMSRIRDATELKGYYVKDPKGDHVVIRFQDSSQVVRGGHVTSYGYILSKSNFEFKEAVHFVRESKSITRSNGCLAWPDESELEAVSEICYSHVPE